MQHFNLRYKLLVITVIALFVWAIAADIPFTFKPGDLISADQMNQNFAALNTGKQELVKGTCAAGSSIRIIATDGSVTCEVDDISTGAGDAGVDAINGMTGAVTLQAGDNITIDDATPGQIKISSSSGGSTYTADNSSLTLIGTTFSVKNAGVTAGKIALPLALSSAADNGAIFSVTNSGIFDTIGVLGRSGAAFLTAPDFNAGVLGDSKDGFGVVGASESNSAVAGFSVSGHGVIGESSSGIGIQGTSTDGTGVYGQTSGSNYGVRGYSPAGRGVFGESQTGIGVYGTSNSNDAVVGITGPNDTAHAAIAGSSDKGYAAYFEAGLGVGQGYATCTFKAGTTNWACSSDRNLKENFEAVNSKQVLETVAQMPVTTWTMKGSTFRQMGPTSQDFYSAFNLGDSDKTINNTDAQGVALAAIQGLYQLVQEQQVKIEALEAQLANR